MVLAYFLGLGILALYFLFNVPIYPDAGLAAPGMLRDMAISGSPLIVLAMVLAYIHVRKRIKRAALWLLEHREATETERQQLLSLPREGATIGLCYWMFGCIYVNWFLRFVAHYEPANAFWIKAAISIPLVGIVPAALSYLFIERALRSLVGQALRGASVLPKTMGVSRRLLLAWLCTGGLPIAGIVLAAAGLGERQLSSLTPLLYVVGGLGLVAGVAVAAFSGQAITDPIRKVQRGLRTIASGDIDVELPVSESAELGELQIGFNLMTAGLRERERLREVFGHHVGTEVAQRAIAGPVALGGELREATALFVDIISSTSLAQQRSPNEVVATLNAFFDAVVRCVGAEGGFVNKFEGDGALCIFGAPVEQPDHATRALRAARALRHELNALSESLDAAIGVSSGEVVAGNVGAANRYEYTVIGDPVNEAARLTEEAKSRVPRVLVSDSAIRNASDEWENWTQAGTIHLRGRSNPTIAFEPVVEAGSRGSP